MPTEDASCEMLVQFLDLHGFRFSHIPQETFTKSWGIKARNKRMGVRKGIPDYVIVRGARLLFIEMKREKSPPSAVKPEQAEWIAALGSVPGVTAVVCRGYDEAVAAIRSAFAMNDA